MTQQIHQGLQVDAMLVAVGGKGVAEALGRQADVLLAVLLLQPGFLRRHFHKPPDFGVPDTEQGITRLCLAKALLNDPKILFLDEPTVSLDLHATHEEVGRAIRAVIQGVGVLRLQVASDRGESFCGFFSTGERHGLDREMKTGEINLLSLLTQGLSNREISRAVKLSSHTVKHYLEDLREAVGARNRVELAAWAARQGFYQFRSWQ